MSCLDCQKASECHSDILNDIQIIECIRLALDRNQIEMAKDELTIFMRRLHKRNEYLTGRAI